MPNHGLSSIKNTYEFRFVLKVKAGLHGDANASTVAKSVRYAHAFEHSKMADDTILVSTSTMEEWNENFFTLCLRLR